MGKDKIYVLVKNFSGINQDVEILGNFKEAKMAFHTINIISTQKANTTTKNSLKQKFMNWIFLIFLDFRKQI